MELFHEYKNRYFNLVFKILNLSKNGLTKEEILEIINKEAYEEKLVGKDFITFEGLILNEYENHENLNLLKKDENLYYPVIENNKELPLAITFSKIEKQWLKAMLREKNVEDLLGSELVNKLKMNLENVQAISSDIIKRTNQTIYGEIDYKDIEKKFFLIVDAIKNNKILKYTNVTRLGEEYKDKIAIPIRIDYSLKDEELRLSLYSIEEERPIMVLLKNIRGISTYSNINEDIKREDVMLKLKDKKYSKDPIVLEVVDIRGAMERCFMGFSSYERSTKSLGNNKYEVKIYYYTFNADELIRRILALGPYAVVKSPQHIRDRIIEILKEIN